MKSYLVFEIIHGKFGYIPCDLFFVTQASSPVQIIFLIFPIIANVKKSPNFHLSRIFWTVFPNYLKQVQCISLKIAPIFGLPTLENRAPTIYPPKYPAYVTGS